MPEEQVRIGEPGRSGRIVEECEGLIRGFIGRRGALAGAIDAEDLLQEAKIRLWKALEDGRDIRFLAAYVKKIVDSIVCDQLERLRKERSVVQAEGKRRTAEHRDSLNLRSGAGPAAAERLREALPSLGASRRSVLDLAISGLSLAEIAERQNWTLKKTYALYERGLDDLRKIFRVGGGRP